MCALYAFSGTANAGEQYDSIDWRPSLSYYGNVGLIDMPTARFVDDGSFSLAVAAKDPDQRVSFMFQVTPWLEGVFRYSHIDGFLVDQPEFYDRSFGVRLRLVQEGEYWPAVAVGINDLLGTGVFGAEYVVASKRAGPLDFTLGLGWGRFGSAGTVPNPLGLISERMKERDSRDLTDTGQFDLTSYFSGEDMGVFAGVEYSPPVKGLKLQFEYSSDRYKQERAARLVRYNVRSPVNVGAVYEGYEGVEIGAHYLYGTTLGLRLALKGNPLDRIVRKRVDKAPPDFYLRPALGRRPPPETDSLSQMVYDPIVIPLSKPLGRLVDQNPPLRNTLILDQAAQILKAMKDRRRRLRKALHPGGASDMNAQPLPLGVVTLLSDPGATIAPITALCDSRHGDNGDGLARSKPCPRQSGPEQTEAPLRLAAYEDASLLAYLAGTEENTQDTPGADLLEIYGPKIREQAREYFLIVRAMNESGQVLRVIFNNKRYDRPAEALGRMTRILTNLAPAHIEVFELVLAHGVLPVTMVTISRSELERIVASDGLPAEVLASAILEAAPRSYGESEWLGGEQYPSIRWGLEPGFRQSLFDPDNPFRYQVFLRAGFDVALARGLDLNARYGLNLLTNFDEITRGSDSQLPRVRSDFARFLSEGKTGIDQLSLSYSWKLGKETYARVSGGYLEEMFGGGGGEVLYRPHSKRWALGANLFYARQRNFDKGFGFQELDAITGHASVYYQSPFYDIDFNVHAGRYLAGDYGATFEAIRRFKTGVEIGAFATFTNVPFSEFGEGSFDKGIAIRIPFGWFLPYATKRTYRLDLRPLTRDGGQRLSGTTTLFERTKRDSLKDIEWNWDGFFE